eukprot:3454445-Prymnesium_polylepis.1
MAKQQQDRAEQPVQMNRAARILEAMGRAANVKQERAEREQVEEEAKKVKKKHSWAAARKASVTATALAEAADEAKTRRGWLASALGGRRRGNASEGKNKYTNINVGVHIDLAKRKLSDAGERGHLDLNPCSHIEAAVPYCAQCVRPQSTTIAMQMRRRSHEKLLRWRNLSMKQRSMRPTRQKGRWPTPAT